MAGPMAPMAMGDAFPDKYDVPVGFDLGVGDIYELQQELIRDYVSLAIYGNVYFHLCSWLLHRSDKTEDTQLENRKELARWDVQQIRDRLVCAVEQLAYLGAVPLPPPDKLDVDIADLLRPSRILQLLRMPSSPRPPPALPSLLPLPGLPPSLPSQLPKPPWKLLRLPPRLPRPPSQLPRPLPPQLP